MIPFCSIVLVKIISVASGCASTLGGMMKGVTCLSHYSAPKYTALGTNLASAVPILSGVFSCESAFSWAVPSQTLQALALPDKEHLFGWGAMTVPFPSGMWGYCSLGPRLLLSRAFLAQDQQIWACLIGLLSTSLQLQANHKPCPLASHAGLAAPRWHPKPSHRNKDGGRLIGNP